MAAPYSITSICNSCVLWLRSWLCSVVAFMVVFCGCVLWLRSWLCSVVAFMVVFCGCVHGCVLWLRSWLCSVVVFMVMFCGCASVFYVLFPPLIDLVSCIPFIHL